MKKKAALAIVFFLVVVTSMFALNTYGANEIIRVGLTTGEGVGSAGVGGQTVMTGISSGNSFSEIAYFDLSGGADVSRSYSYYISVGSFGDYNEALTYSETLTGYNAIPAYRGGYWSVYIGPYESEERASQAKNNYPYESEVCVPSAETVYLNGSGVRMIYDYSGGNFAVTGDTVTNVNGGSYRGYIEFYPVDGGFTTVNVISLESYLMGVVPSEMPPSWNMEALKAQACAARTYTINKLNSGGSGVGYDICDTTHCQAYQGTANETEATNAAVNATAGTIITYGGSPINAVYCSSLGGVSDDSENVWGSSIPYLKSVKEIEGAESESWSRTYTYSQLTNLLAANGADIGKLVFVSLSRSENGRVYSMTFSGESGSFTVEKENVKTFFSSGEGGSLLNRVFDISFDHSAGENFSLIINGSGWGHGLGMSQFGANSMAAAGYTYDEILKYYYTGVELSGY